MAEAEPDRGRRAGDPDAHGTPAQLPQVFGRYLLLRRLSRGGMGEIFLAKLGEIQGFEKLVIIKKVLPNLAADEEFIKRFIDEAQVAIKLNHANVAPVFEVGRVDGDYFLGIAYIEGRDLRRTVARLRESGRKLAPDLALYVAREVASGLAYAHRRTDDDGRLLNLVHCDVSPPNVMLSFEGEVKIIDFGIARSAIRLAQSNPNMGFGKFGYMAPEQLLRGGVIDKRTDLYAVGVILYELLTGTRLVSAPEGGDYRQVARAVTQGKFPPPSARNPAIPPELDTLVMKAIAANPADRFQSGESLRDAIQTQLARLNPTLSGDDLAHVLRDLFFDELTDERELLQRMNEVDLAPFRDELTEASVGHTVTYARATGEALPSLNAASLQLADDPGIAHLDHEDGAAEITGSLQRVEVDLIDDPRDDQGEPAGHRTGARIVALVVIAMLSSFGLVVLFYRLHMANTLPSPTVPTATTPSVAQPTVTKPAEPAVVPPVVTQPLPLPHVQAPDDRRSKRHSKEHGTKEKDASAATHSPDAVQAKFQKVRSEYGAFKSQYGAVLEERWNAVASEITFGKADKFEHVDKLLDGLRHEMAHVRDGR